MATPRALPAWGHGALAGAGCSASELRSGFFAELRFWSRSVVEGRNNLMVHRAALSCCLSANCLLLTALAALPPKMKRLSRVRLLRRAVISAGV